MARHFGQMPIEEALLRGMYGSVSRSTFFLLAGLYRVLAIVFPPPARRDTVGRDEPPIPMIPPPGAGNHAPAIRPQPPPPSFAPPRGAPRRRGGRASPRPPSGRSGPGRAGRRPGRAP